MKTKEDVIEALRQIHYLERTAELAYKYRRDPKGKRVPKAKKEKVIEIANKLGYHCEYQGDRYYLGKDGIGDYHDWPILVFFRESWVLFTIEYRENGEWIYGNRCDALKVAVAGDDSYRNGSPAYTSYEELEEIMAEIVSIYEDAGKALYGLDGISERGRAEYEKPDFKLSVTKDIILDALRKINFLERSQELSKQFRNHFPEIMPNIDVVRVKEIIRKLGYEPGNTGKSFYLKEQAPDNLVFRFAFGLKYGLFNISWTVSDEGEFVYGGPWLIFKRALLGSLEVRGDSVSFGSYEELEEILKIVLEMYEEFKQAVLKRRR